MAPVNPFTSADYTFTPPPSAQLMEMITGPMAARLVQQAQFPPPGDTPLVVLDTACGSGIVTSQIISRLSTRDRQRVGLTCTDVNEAVITGLKGLIDAEVPGWAGVRALVADAMDTKLPASHFTHIFFSFGPMLLSNPMAGLGECHRLLQPHGVLAFTTWQTVPWFGEYRAAFARNPALPPFPTDDALHNAFSDHPERWQTVADVRANFERAGFDQVDVRLAENTTHMTMDQVEAMLPFTVGILMPTTGSKEEGDQHMEPAKQAIRDHLKEKFPDGTVTWTWVANVATGRKA